MARPSEETEMSKKDVEVYLMAAERIELEDSDRSCITISEVVCGKSNGETGYRWEQKQRALYAEAFGFSPTENCYAIDRMSKTKQKAFRILALCFAAAMAETGDL